LTEGLSVIRDEVRLDALDKPLATALARMMLYAIVQVAVFFYTGEPATRLDVAAAHGGW
jgi:hypothetical protein